MAEQRNMKPLTEEEKLDLWYEKNVRGRHRRQKMLEKEIREEEVCARVRVCDQPFKILKPRSDTMWLYECGCVFASCPGETVVLRLRRKEKRFDHHKCSLLFLFLINVILVVIFLRHHCLVRPDPILPFCHFGPISAHPLYVLDGCFWRSST